MFFKTFRFSSTNKCITYHSDQPINDCKLIEKYCGDILQILERLQAGECTLKGLVEFKLFQCRQLLLDTGKYSMSEVRRSFQLRIRWNNQSLLNFVNLV